MANLLAHGSPTTIINDQTLNAHLDRALEHWCKNARRVLLVPPDITRLNSYAGPITAYLYHQLTQRNIHTDVMPALGTHKPMKPVQCERMFPGVPMSRILEHRWRDDLITLGQVPAERMNALSEGRLAKAGIDQPMTVAINKALIEGRYDKVLSIGQVVPHEVIGIANYTKNILIGVGGQDTIHHSHFLGAVYGMERIMGRIHTPVRAALNDAFHSLVAPRVDIGFLLTVMANDHDTNRYVMRGFYAGDDDDTFNQAAELSRATNFDILDEPIQTAVVYLDPDEFTTTWLGNKAIYRTRMAMADGGHLIILAPALEGFGEDERIDQLIAQFGYHGTDATLAALKAHPELRNNLSAAAHLIHGSSEGRFRITYCPGPHISLEQVQRVGFDTMPYEQAASQYALPRLKDGHNTLDGQPVFYISNPALGLWAHRDRLHD